MLSCHELTYMCIIISGKDISTKEYEDPTSMSQICPVLPKSTYTPLSTESVPILLHTPILLQARNKFIKPVMRLEDYDEKSQKTDENLPSTKMNTLKYHLSGTHLSEDIIIISCTI